MTETPTPPIPAPDAAPILPEPIDATPVLETRRLTKSFGSLVALDDLSLKLYRGDVFGFIGPNGAGKSTTMKTLAGLMRPTSGEALVLGKPVEGNGDFVRRSVGYMPDFLGVYEDLTVTEYLEFFASAYHIPSGQRGKVVHDVLELTDLSFKRDAMVDSLSRGMTQRLSLARVLVHDPPILLLDEPASGLDPRARIEMRELLRELQRLGKTMIVSSHILSELGEFCNKLGIIERGKLLVCGTVDELMARARTQPMICVHVHAEHDRAHAVLSADPRVATADRHGDALHVTLRDASSHHYFIAEVLVSHSIPVHSLTPEQIKLEDVFLRLTKGVAN